MSAKRFHDKMVEYLDEYQKFLLVKQNGTGASHCDIIHQFVNYLFNYHLVSCFEQITVSMANSKFLTLYKRQNKELIEKVTMKNILNGFFTFIYGKYGIINPKLMKGLKN